MKISNLINKLIITEKSNSLKDSNVYVVKVLDSMTKHSISTHIRDIFGVDVVKVRTAIMPSKPKTVYSKSTKKRTTIRTGRFKKAYIVLKSGQKIDITKENK
jgi:ribosomal protein L23